MIDSEQIAEDRRKGEQNLRDLQRKAMRVVK